MQLIFLQPLFKERIWGGHRLKTDYGYPIPSNQTGECWAISAHKNGDTPIKHGQFAHLTLSQLWQEHPELFANEQKRPFPLMVKILDANDDLSVQVHPDDNFAQMVENDFGKTECWYVLAAKPNARIIYGHTAKNNEQFKQMAENQQWQQLLSSRPVTAGDFFAVPTGTVHALGAGTLILEVQQSSDTTYRLYDYDRRDNAGNLRELHLDKAFAVIKTPHVDAPGASPSRPLNRDALFTPLTTNQYFQVGKLQVQGHLELTISVPYLLVSVIDGAGSVNGESISKGDHFIIPNPIRKIHISGNVTLITANETSG